MTTTTKAAVAVCERPIIFSAPMVRAILDGRKTQTRRIIAEKDRIGYPHSEIQFACDEYFTTTGNLSFELKCPYGKSGERLWIREAWRVFKRYDEDRPAFIRDEPELAGLHFEADGPATHTHGRLRPSIFLPRRWSRVLLELTDVRAERLQSIGEEDAEAEGCQPWQFNPEQPLTSGERAGDSPYRSGYALLWDEINDAVATWKSDPWVWVLSFNRLAAGEGK